MLDLAAAARKSGVRPANAQRLGESPRAALRRQTMAAQETAAERMHKSGLAWGDGRYKDPHTYDGKFPGE